MMTEGELKKRIAQLIGGHHRENIAHPATISMTRTIIDEAQKDFPIYIFAIDWMDDEKVIDPRGAIENLKEWYSKWFDNSK